MKCHVVLWIPTLVYTDFDKPVETQIERNISDYPGNELGIKLELIDGKDFRVSVRNGDDGTYSEIVYLKRVSKSSNGLLQFTYLSTTDKEEGFRFTRKEFPTVIYHLIKSFYHVHDFHESDADSTFRPFLADDWVDIQAENNDAILHYLRMYGEFMTFLVETLQFAIRRVRENEKLAEPATRNTIQKLCLKAKGFEVYMGVLYHSKYNSICATDSKDRKWRHVACNIENGMNFVRTVEHEYGEYTQQTFVKDVKREADKSMKAAKLSIGLGLGSVALAIVSIVVAFLISQHSSSELRDVTDSIKQNIGTIPSELSSINSQIDSLFLENEKTTKAVEDVVKRQWTIIHRLEDQEEDQ